MTQLRKGQIEAIQLDLDVKQIAFDWTEAILEKHSDHISDFGIDLAGLVREVADLPDDYDTTAITPALVAVDFDKEGQLIGCVVFIVFEQSSQFAEVHIGTMQGEQG